MALFTDQLGRSVELYSAPTKIVSLVPSQTELLSYLGLDSQVVGITKFCVHPTSWFQGKTRVGGTKAVKKDIIQQLAPDLIIANKEENVQEQVNELARHYPVWISDIHDLPSALDMIGRIGELTGTKDKAEELVTKISTGFDALHIPPSAKRTAYLIWRDPYMTIGRDTFIHDMLTRCGLQNVFSNTTRYPEITVSQLQAAGCELLLLSSEPYPFKQKHIDELQEQLPDTKIVLVDGELFSWYGSRLLLAPPYYSTLLAQIS
jgi:ABC-type Fe3+-hydroxamate transport system substrate-binding protein